MLCSACVCSSVLHVYIYTYTHVLFVVHVLLHVVSLLSCLVQSHVQRIADFDAATAARYSKLRVERLLKIYYTEFTWLAETRLA